MSNTTKDNPALRADKPSSYLVIVVDTLAEPELKPGVAGWPSSWFDYVVKASDEEEAARLAVEQIRHERDEEDEENCIYTAAAVLDRDQLQRILNLMV